MNNIWLFPKWYPNKEDPQLGVFIQKHARAIARKNNISVLYIHSVSNTDKKYEIVFQKTENVQEIIIYFRKDRSAFRSLVNFIRYIKSVSNGIKILKEKSPKPDVVHAYILLRTGFIAKYISMKYKIPYVVSEQWSGYVTGRFERKPALWKLLSKNIVKNAAALTVVSRFLAGGMKKAGLTNKNLFITPNCIETIRTETTMTTHQSVYVLLVADLVDEIKNISGVIRMISTLEEINNFELHIIGHGKDEKMLKKLVEDLSIGGKVFFEGLKTNTEVYHYLQKCDFLVMNSRYETFSLICAEAMSCGKPVLATRCGGPDEFVTPLTGLLIDPDDSEALRNSFNYMLTNFGSFDKQKIINFAHQLFSPERSSEEFDKVYQTALRGGK